MIKISWQLVAYLSLMWAAVVYTISNNAQCVVKSNNMNIQRSQKIERQRTVIVV